MIWFSWVSWHINHCRLFNAKSSLYIYIRYIRFGLVGFYGISTIVDFLHTFKRFQVLLYNSHNLASVICLHTVCHFWPIDRTLPGTTTLSLSELGSNGNKGVLNILLISSITGASPSDGLMSHPGHLLGGILPLCRDAAGVFYNPNQLRLFY